MDVSLRAWCVSACAFICICMFACVSVHIVHVCACMCVSVYVFERETTWEWVVRKGFFEFMIFKPRPEERNEKAMPRAGRRFWAVTWACAQPLSSPPLNHPWVSTNLACSRIWNGSMDEAHRRQKKVKGDKGRGLRRRWVLEGFQGQEFGFCFEKSGPTMEHLVKGGLGFVL